MKTWRDTPSITGNKKMEKNLKSTSTSCSSPVSKLQQPVLAFVTDEMHNHT